MGFFQAHQPKNRHRDEGHAPKHNGEGFDVLSEIGCSPVLEKLSAGPEGQGDFDHVLENTEIPGRLRDDDRQCDGNRDEASGGVGKGEVEGHEEEVDGQAEIEPQDE